MQNDTLKKTFAGLLAVAGCSNPDLPCESISLNNYKPSPQFIVEINHATDQIGTNLVTGGFEGLHDLFSNHANNPEETIYALRQIEENVRDSAFTKAVAIAYYHTTDSCLQERVCSELESDNLYQDCIEEKLIPFSH